MKKQAWLTWMVMGVMKWMWKSPHQAVYTSSSPHAQPVSPAEAFLMAGAWCSGRGDALSSERDEYNVSSRDEIFFSSHFKI